MSLVQDLTQLEHYRVLQVDPAADQEVIRAAYRVLARRYHPDISDLPDAELRMARVNRAYAVLGDPDSRRAYDAERAAPPLRSKPVVPPPPIVVPPSRWQRGTDAHSRQSTGGRSGQGAAASMTLDFGRYQGWSLQAIGRVDPDYLRWLQRHSSGARFRRPIGEVLQAQARR